MNKYGQRGCDPMMTALKQQLELGLPTSAQVVAVESLSGTSLPGCYEVAVCGPAEDGSPFDSVQAKPSDREARNKAEKQRRNLLNSHINVLSALLPVVVHSTRKVDKTGILRLAANDLRDEHIFGNSIRCGHLDPSPAKALALLDLLDGFLVVLTCRGIIVNISPNIQKYLGHCRIDLLGQNIYSLIHKDDEDSLKEHIYPQELQNAYDSAYCNAFGSQQEFYIKVMRACARTDPPRYEKCRVDGFLRRADRANPHGICDDQVPIRRARVRRDRTFSSSGNDAVFIGMVRVMPRALPPRIPPPGSHTEYWTRHLIDGRIVQCDQHISLVAGYMTAEILGSSAFTFMHKDDVRWVVCVLRQMYDTSKEFGESCYRLMSRTGKFIFLRTRGFLEIDKTTKQVKSFVCMNTVMTEFEGKKLIAEMKRRYSVLVTSERNELERPVDDEMPVEHPKKLERVIMHLVTNLPPSPGSAQPDLAVAGGSSPSPCKVLTIIPPESESISLGIHTAATVITQAAGVQFGPCGTVIPNRKRKIGKTGCDSDSESDDVKRPSVEP